MKYVLIVGGLAFLLWQLGLWFLFGRLQMARWLSLLPGYNLYRLCQVVWGQGWYALFFLLPVGGLFFWIWTMLRVGTGFRQSLGYSVVLLLVFPVGAFLLPRKRFIGGQKLGKWMLLCIGILGVLGTVVVGYGIVRGYAPAVTSLYASQVTRSEVVLSDTDVSTHPAFSMETVSRKGLSDVTMPVLTGSEQTAQGLSFQGNGLTVSVALQKNQETPTMDLLPVILEDETKALLGAGFVNPVVGDVYGDMHTKQDALSQLNYETPEGGKHYRMFRLIQQDSATVLIAVDYDGAHVTEETTRLLAELCTVYGLTFQGDVITRDVTKPIEPITP